MTIRVGAGLVCFSNVVDRFMPQGYRQGLPFEEGLLGIWDSGLLDAVALDFPMQFDDPAKIKVLLDRYAISVCVLELGIYGERRWTKGSLAAADPGTRRQAIEVCKQGLDAAAYLAIPEVLLWPGQDGYEYPFQSNYRLAWDAFIDGIREVAAHRPEIRIGIEYKPKEPRTRCYIDSAAKALLLCQTINLPNVGVTVDLGHSLAAQESPGEAVALCARYDRLFQIHVNDNYGDWDSDLIVGQVNLWRSLEFFYWLKKSGFDSWYIMDFFPYREDGPAALAQCIRNTRRLEAMATRLLDSPVETLQTQDDPLAISELLWQTFVRVQRDE